MTRPSEFDLSPRGPRRSLAGTLYTGLLAALLVGAVGCGGSGDSASGTTTASTTTRTPTGPSAARVDLEEPTFSDPLSITNPLFPRGGRRQVIQLGAEGDEKLRFEVTQLPRTKLVEWKGKQIETSVTHFVAYGDGRILEVAVDFFAQADDGSVWYFGENVDNYEDGKIANHEGTWLAGKDGPPGMIMPADPQVGDVYRPENIPGLVFEEVTVRSVDKTVEGPRGFVTGAVAVQERLMDGTLEDKIFAPGYGEFQARVESAEELYNVALAVPIDVRREPLPRQLSTLSAGASSVFESAPSRNWNRLSATADRMRTAWDTYRAGDVPELLETEAGEALAALDEAIAARKPLEVRQAAIDVGHASLDLQLQFRPIADIDRARLGLWRRQMLLDRAAGDSAGVAGDRATLKAIQDRIPG